jgi:hypothetical protein
LRGDLLFFCNVATPFAGESAHHQLAAQHAAAAAGAAQLKLLCIALKAENTELKHAAAHDAQLTDAAGIYSVTDTAHALAATDARESPAADVHVLSTAEAAREFSVVQAPSGESEHLADWRLAAVSARNMLASGRNDGGCSIVVASNGSEGSVARASCAGSAGCGGGAVDGPRGVVLEGALCETTSEDSATLHHTLDAKLKLVAKPIEVLEPRLNAAEYYQEQTASLSSAACVSASITARDSARASTHVSARVPSPMSAPMISRMSAIAVAPASVSAGINAADGDNTINAADGDNTGINVSKDCTGVNVASADNPGINVANGNNTCDNVAVGECTGINVAADGNRTVV